MTMGPFLDLSGSRFLHLCNGNDHSLYLIGLLGGEVLYMEYRPGENGPLGRAQGSGAGLEPADMQEARASRFGEKCL